MTAKLWFTADLHTLSDLIQSAPRLREASDKLIEESQ